MKKQFYLLFTLLLCSTISCLAQTQQEDELKGEFYKQLNILNKEKKQAINEKNYAQVEQCNWNIIHNYEKLPEKVQKEIGLNYGYYYYDIACYQSLQKKKEEALKHFELAYQNGYSNYNHILKDTDLDYIRKEKKFQETLAKFKEEGDYLYILQKSPQYATNEQTDTLPHFTYANQSDSNLIKVRQYFKLDSVAGNGDEISKIKKLLTFVHNKIMHDGQHGNPKQLNAIAMAEACKDGSRGLNCRGLATVLNECYLAMGFKSRFLTCMPKKYISDCHVINTVYSETLKKWIWMDPTNNAWVMDENGNLLGIKEVRERLCDGRPLILNEEANWNNKQKTVKEEYLDNYMAKNLYYVNCTLRSEFGTEDKKYNPADYVALMPNGYYNDMEKGSYIIYDDDWFWQAPYQK